MKANTLYKIYVNPENLDEILSELDREGKKVHVHLDDPLAVLEVTL